MAEIHRILDQMDRAFSGDAWHGPPLMRLLDGVSAEDASKHIVPGAHSMWELVHHIGAWNSIVQHRLQGETVDVTTERIGLPYGKSASPRGSARCKISRKAARASAMWPPRCATISSTRKPAPPPYRAIRFSTA